MSYGDRSVRPSARELVRQRTPREGLLPRGAFAGTTRFPYADRLMAHRQARLAAAVVNVVERDAENPTLRFWHRPIIRRRDSGVTLISALQLTDHCCLLLVRECPLNATRRKQSPGLFTRHLLFRQPTNSYLLRAIVQAYFEKTASSQFVSDRGNFSKVAILLGGW